VRVAVLDEVLEIRLSWWEKALGLMRNIRVARSAVSEVGVQDDPLPAMKGTGLKAGLRLPGFYYVCRGIKLDRAWIVRRGVPALTFTVRDGSPLAHVTVSTPDAAELARRLREGSNGA
jgi:hypothetical protein